jgi:hypothetical protein
VRPGTSTRGWRVAGSLLALLLLAAGPALGQARGENCELYLHTLPNAGASLENWGSGATAVVGVTAGQASPTGTMEGRRTGRQAQLGFWGTVDVMSVPEPSQGALGLAALVAIAALGGSVQGRRPAPTSGHRGSGLRQRRSRARSSR